MCCACGGGSTRSVHTSYASTYTYTYEEPAYEPPCTDTDNGVTGTEYGCASIPSYEVCANEAFMNDDDDFTASVMCCACGGGYTPYSPGTVAPPPAASAPPMGSCVQLDAASDGWLTADCEREISTQGEPQPCPEPCP